MEDRWDAIVCGGGSAGCVVAARLSEEPERRVCLVEAGRDYVLIVRPGVPEAVAANGFAWLGERIDEVIAMTRAAA